MPAPPLSNTFEGGTDTTVISGANSGGASGDAFTVIDATAVTFSTANPAHGSLAGRLVNPAGRSDVGWSGLGSLTTDTWFRAYCCIQANPTDTLTVIGTYTAAAGNNCYICIETTGRVSARNAAFAALATGTVSVPLGTVFRVEARIRASATVGQAEFKWWSTKDDTGTPTDTASATGAVLGANLDTVVFANGASVGPITATLDFDDVAASSTGWIGPTVVASSGAILPTWPRVRFNG